EGLQQLRQQADQDVEIAITNINRDLADLYALNETIETMHSVGNPLGELLDHRDELLRDIASYMDIDTFYSTSGSVSISTAAGEALLDDNLYNLSYTKAGSINSFINDSNLNPILVYRINREGNPVGQPRELVSEGSRDTIVSRIGGGAMKGLLTLR